MFRKGPGLSLRHNPLSHVTVDVPSRHASYRVAILLQIRMLS